MFKMMRPSDLTLGDQVNKNALEGPWRVSAGFLTINLNGWFTKISKGNSGPQAACSKNVFRYQSLLAALKRHKVSMVGVQEHHWSSEDDVAKVNGWLLPKGWGVEGTWSRKRDGVALLWNKSEWTLLNSLAFEPRLLLGKFLHSSGDEIVILVGHFEVDPLQRKLQWEGLQKWARNNNEVVHVMLSDHNSVLHGGATSRWRPDLAPSELHAMESEDNALGEMQLLDSWDVLHGEGVDVPGYTHVYKRGDLQVHRRIDRINVR